MEIVIIIVMAILLIKIVLPLLFVFFRLLWTPVELFWQVVWSAKWLLLAGIAVLLLLSAFGVFA